MSLPAEMEKALRRINAALDQLEAAVDRRVQGDAIRGNLSEEMNILQDDRSRLAVELDGALAQGQTLALTSEEVVRRLERASTTIRSILAQAEAAE